LTPILAVTVHLLPHPEQRPTPGSVGVVSRGHLTTSNYVYLFPAARHRDCGSSLACLETCKAYDPTVTLATQTLAELRRHSNTQRSQASSLCDKLPPDEMQQLSSNHHAHTSHMQHRGPGESKTRGAFTTNGDGAMTIPQAPPGELFNSQPRTGNMMAGGKPFDIARSPPNPATKSTHNL
jgi:hypothetical protein